LFGLGLGAILRDKRLLLSLASIAVGFVLFAVFAWCQHQGIDFPVLAYWFSFGFVAAPLVVDLVFKGGRSDLRLFYLVTFSVMLNLQYLAVNSSPFIGDSDGIFSYSLSNQILSDHWKPGMGYIYDRAFTYSYYPVMSFLSIVTSFTTGLPLIAVYKYLFMVGGIVVPILVLRFLQNFTDNDSAYLATLIVVATPGAILFPHNQTIGLVFLVLTMFLITSVKTTSSRQFVLLGFLSVTALILTHHFTTYVFMAILVALVIGSYVLKWRIKVEPSKIFALFCVVLFAAWLVYVTFSVGQSHASQVVTVLLPSQTSTSIGTPLPLAFESSTVEVALLYGGFGLTMASAFVGFLFFMRERKQHPYDFVMLAVLFGPLLIFSIFFRFASVSHNLDLSHRVWAFAYIAVGFFSSYTFAKLRNISKKLFMNIAVVLAILCILIVGPLGGALGPHFQGQEQSRYISYDGLEATVWLNSHSIGSESIISDQVEGMTYWLFSGYGGRVTTYKPELFNGSSVYPTLGHLSSDEKFLVANGYDNELAKRMDWPQNPDLYQSFDRCPFLAGVYSNGEFVIYRFNNGTTEKATLG
jgi:hypothetical protein